MHTKNKMITKIKTEQNYKEVRETISLNVNEKEILVYKSIKIDDIFDNYDVDFEIDSVDLDGLSEDEIEEINEFMRKN